jgi:hypothetical protein
VKDPNGQRPPELSDLRGSGALEQDATTVILLHKVKSVIDVWKSNPPFFFLDEHGCEDERLRVEREKSIAAANWNLAKNQNGPTGELPFVVFQNCFKWFVGDRDQDEKSGQTYQKIEADWRFMEEPFLSAEKKGAVVYPVFWAQKCAELCGKMGIDIPPQIQGDLSKWDYERYDNLRREYAERMKDAKTASTTAIVFDEPTPPSVGAIVEKAKPIVTDRTVQHTVSGSYVPPKPFETSIEEPDWGEESSTSESTFVDEFEDEDF